MEINHRSIVSSFLLVKKKENPQDSVFFIFTYKLLTKFGNCV